MSTASRRSGRDWFFIGYAVLLLAIMAVGFSPTFYLRQVLGTDHFAVGLQTLPPRLHVHGILLTAWFLLLLVQALLIRAGNTGLHRRLGVAGVILAVALVLTTLLVIVRGVPRTLLLGVPQGQLPLLLVGDIGALVIFGGLVAAAVYLRGRPDSHKRLMLLASVAIVVPAISRWPGAAEYLPISLMVPQLLLLLAPIVYDLVRLRRVHPATGWGVAFYLLGSVLSTAAAMSPLGQSFIRAIS